jgi:hypothetical protein
MTTKKSTAKANRCKSYVEQHRAIQRRITKSEANSCYDLTLAEKQREIEARAVYDVIQVCSPDFIAIGLMKLLDDAAKSKGLRRPLFSEDEGETKAEAIKMIMDIFACAYNYKPADKDSPAALAAHLSAVVNHPLLPTEVYNPLADALSELDTHVDHSSPEYFERALVACIAAKGGAR